MSCIFFFFQAEDGIRDVAVTGVQTCALPILGHPAARDEIDAIHSHQAERPGDLVGEERRSVEQARVCGELRIPGRSEDAADRKSTRLNSSHGYISYAVFCLKKKKKENEEKRC